MRQTTGVGVLDRTIAILDAVEHAPMGSSELAHHLGLSVPTAHRLVAAMVAHGLLRRDEQGLHHHGQRFSTSKLVMVEPALKDLSARTGETAQLWVRRADLRVCQATCDSTYELRATVPVGTALALSEGGSAAELLAPGAEDRPDRVVESVSQRTPGLCSASAAVRLDGEVIAALCVAAPVSRTDGAGPAHQYGNDLLAAARRMERALEGRPEHV